MMLFCSERMSDRSTAVVRHVDAPRILRSAAVSHRSMEDKLYSCRRNRQHLGRNQPHAAGCLSVPRRQVPWKLQGGRPLRHLLHSG